MKANRVSALTLGLLLLDGCVSAPPPPAAPPPRVIAPAPPRPAPIASPPADWRDAPRTPGEWQWAVVAGRSTASYGPRGQPALVQLSCETRGQATILWTNNPVVGPTPMTVTTTSTRRLLTGQPDAVQGSSVTLPAHDPLLDAMAFSRGRFMVEVAGFPVLYLPAWPELSRVIEDCR